MDFDKNNYKDDFKKDKEEENCVSINIFCDDCKKNTKYKEDGCKSERKDDKSCVSINIFCDGCRKQSKCKEFDCKDNCKKEYDCKDDKFV